MRKSVRLIVAALLALGGLAATVTPASATIKCGPCNGCCTAGR